MAASGELHWMHKHPEKIRRGSAHGKAKLTEKDVVNIWKLFYTRPDLTLKEIGGYFNVSEGCISMIVRRLTWRHVLVPEIKRRR